jgi:hypothetical protein
LTYGIYVQAPGGTATIRNTVVRNNSTGSKPLSIGMYEVAAAGLQTEVFAEDDVLHITIGFKFQNWGGTEKIFSSSDNRLVYYTANVMGGGYRRSAESSRGDFLERPFA